MIIVVLLVGQFNSIRRPLIILLTIPLAVIGVVFGLLVARSYFGFMTLPGIKIEIVLTIFTTVGGLIPLWYGGGVMVQPMAITIIFGLIFATALTLGLVPILYSLFFRVGFREFESS